MAKKPMPEGKRFQKGQSGNPNGRPPDALNAAMKKLTKAELEDIASILIRSKLSELKTRIKSPNTTILQAMVLGVAAKAIQKGDASAFNALLDRLVGKVKEHTHFTGDVAQPVVVNFNGIKKDKRNDGK